MKQEIIGAGAAFLLDRLWESLPQKKQYSLALKSMSSPTGEPEKSPLAFIEHHHWGMASILLGRALPKYSKYLYGIGGVLIASEMLQENPFGTGKTASEMQGNAMLFLILGSLLTASFIKANTTKNNP